MLVATQDSEETGHCKKKGGKESDGEDRRERGQEGKDPWQNADIILY